MIGGTWTAEQKKAYRAAFTIGRLGDELCLLVLLSWFALADVALAYLGGGIKFVLGVFAGFAALYATAWHLLVPWLVSTMPDELRASLPSDRFAGASSPGAPRTYRDLLRRWLARRDA
jgi:hypothetical protein